MMLVRPSLFCMCAAFAILAQGNLMAEEKPVPEALNFTMKSLEGKVVDLKEYQGKVLLVVNVASRCGATPQYEAMQDLHKTFQEDGLVVLGFPCNQFGAQEPGSAEQIREFCSTNYGVSFPMFAKIDVNGENAAPLYQYLTSVETKPKKSGKIGWNFEKFLINRQGEVVARFGTRTQPDDPQVVEAIRAELAP
jgi:glutathione peroxidase